MAGLLDFFSPEAGQRRTAALGGLVDRAEYYVPPELRSILGFAGEMSPVAGLQRAGQASERMLDPSRTGGQRFGDLGEMLSETAGVAAPMAVAGRAGMPIAQAMQEGLLGFSAGADDVGRRVLDRLNQPGPVPTMYSNPLGGAKPKTSAAELRRQANIQRFGYDPSAVPEAPAPQDISEGFQAYLNQVNPDARRIPPENRPNLMMGDMYGMLPKGAKLVKSSDDVSYYRGPEGDYFATAYNPDVGEMDVVGYSMGGGRETDLQVVDQMQGKGIGGELQYLFRKENPNAPTGGLTEAGEKSLQKTYKRLSDEGVLSMIPASRRQY